MLLLPAAVTLADAADTQRLLSQALRSQVDPGVVVVVVDATPLRRFDSSTLAVLLECRRLAAAKGKAFSVRGAPEKLVALAALYGLAGVLAFEDASPRTGGPIA